LSSSLSKFRLVERREDLRNAAAVRSSALKPARLTDGEAGNERLPLVLDDQTR
jgi:hypothetical protein